MNLTYIMSPLVTAIKNDISIDQLTYEELGDQLSRHFLRQQPTKSSVRVKHRSRQMVPYVLRMNHRHHHHHNNHHHDYHQLSSIRETIALETVSAASASAVASKRQSQDAADDDHHVEYGFNGLMCSLDGISAHDERHRMPEACQAALEKAIKLLQSNCSSKPPSTKVMVAAREGGPVDAPPHAAASASASLGNYMMAAATAAAASMASKASSPSPSRSFRQQQQQQQQHLATTNVPFATGNANSPHAAVAAGAGAGAGAGSVGRGGVGGGGGDGVKKAKGVVVIEGGMGCGKEETVTWLKRVCRNR